MFNRPFLILIIFCLMLGLTVLYHHNKAIKKDHIIETITLDHNRALARLQTMEKQLQRLVTIDHKHTKELADAKSENNRLRIDIATGVKRLQLQASCTHTSNPTASPRVDDATQPRLNHTALQHYFHLREGIDTATQQINALQDYITQVCLAH